ncbi:MAG: hypothetical protein LIP16_16210 [Clostridium sp.]|nr:hypothetical protein [Clostridium sp.]
MKLFLDITSQFLAEKRDYYKKRAGALWIVSAILWPSGMIAGYVFFHFGLMRLALLGAAGLLFAAALTTVWAKENYVKAGVYGQIREDLMLIRQLANEKAQKDAAGRRPA